jgi:hypothetical protein
MLFCHKGTKALIFSYKGTKLFAIAMDRTEASGTNNKDLLFVPDAS